MRGGGSAEERAADEPVRDRVRLEQPPHLPPPHREPSRGVQQRGGVSRHRDMRGEPPP